MAGFRLLHVGCGEVYRPDAVNVDLHDSTVADLLCDAARLPFADATFQEIEANQVLEHLDFAGVTTALAEFHRVLVPNGLLALETNPIPIKTALAMGGVLSEEFRLPMCPMSSEKRASLETILSQGADAADAGRSAKARQIA